jgi:hypothetical protein
MKFENKFLVLKLRNLAARFTKTKSFGVMVTAHEYEGILFPLHLTHLLGQILQNIVYISSSRK